MRFEQLSATRQPERNFKRLETIKLGYQELPRLCQILGKHHRLTVIADIIGIAPELDDKYIKTLTRFNLFRCFSVLLNNEGKSNE